MALHFVSCCLCGLANFVLLETSAENLKFRIEAELPLALHGYIQLRTSNFHFFSSRHCHGRMDFELTDFGSLQLLTGCHFWQMW